MTTKDLSSRQATVLLPELPAAAPLPGAVLFAFDDRAFPYRQSLQMHLIAGEKPRLVLAPGPAGSHDEGILFYGSVIKIGDTFHMWYNGNYGPYRNTVNYERTHCVLCYANSKDGVHWEKPNLGLVEFNGSKNNNIVALDEPTLWSTAAVLYDSEEPDPKRRFKIAFEATFDGYGQLCVGYSADGLCWMRPFRGTGIGLEMSGITKHRGMYYVTGQGAGTTDYIVTSRKMVVVASADFEHWSPCPIIALDRSPQARTTAQEADVSTTEEVHLGAGLWNRGNVILGVYGQWHGHPSGDRALVSIDLGLVISHDAQQYHEPIPNFKLVPAREQKDRTPGFGPALEQGQGMVNHGDQTLFWYSLWHGPAASGVRMVTWKRDRLGMLKPFRSQGAQAISSLIQAQGGALPVAINASGLSEHSQMRVSLLDRGFCPITGFSGKDAAIVDADGLRTPLRWKGGEAITPEMGLLRIQVEFAGIRPEDACLHAVYVGQEME